MNTVKAGDGGDAGGEGGKGENSPGAIKSLTGIWPDISIMQYYPTGLLKNRSVNNFMLST